MDNVVPTGRRDIVSGDWLIRLRLDDVLEGSHVSVFFMVEQYNPLAGADGRPSSVIAARSLKSFGSRWIDGVDHVVTDAWSDGCGEGRSVHGIYGVYGIEITPRLEDYVPECWPACAFGE